ncbi:hypothetical protein MMC14_000279 [Varicellaria rhodocarpa]|nr:hypothetical protein [Varicellaria rhodocarpa]
MAGASSSQDPHSSSLASEPPPTKLSASEYRVYNSMAEHMEYFHSSFRQTWKILYAVCSSGKRPSNMSLRQFLNTGLQFCYHLGVHHSIEEQHIFPVLAKKMPAFREELTLLTQHKEIHQGLDQFEAYLKRCNTGETDLKLDDLKGLMDGFKDVLWSHLDAEVKELEAENMRKYWTISEMKQMPM